MNNTLIIYRDWWEAIKSLPTELRLEAFEAICAYAFEGEQPENPVISAVTALMRSAIDRNKTKWEDVREKRRQAINTRWNRLKEQKNTPQTQENKSIQTNTNVSPEQPTEAKPEPTPSDADTELEQEFNAFRTMYPGHKRGLAIELGNLKKKYPKEWKKIIPLLRPAVERLIDYHKRAEAAQAAGAHIFVPNYAYLQTWINQARWQEEFPELDGSSPSAQDIEPDYEDNDFGGRIY